MVEQTNHELQPMIRKERQNSERRIAYFSMEIGLSSRMPTYSGGLGVLAGDTIKSFADLNIPAVAVTLLYRKGYFDQTIDSGGNQGEQPAAWDPGDFLTLLPRTVTVTISGRTVLVQAWQYIVNGVSEYSVPVLFLDTDLEENSPYDRSLSDSLYGGDQAYRMAQEIVLGVGGVRMLRELGFTQLNRYHMNEGHASFLTLELLRERPRQPDGGWDIEAVRRLCVFTTHTPVPAGHDQFEYPLVHSILNDYVPMELLQEVGGKDRLNMTLLALNLSHYINGVAKEHGKISREMFPGYVINSITNGVHSYTWVSEHFKMLYNKYIPGWVNDPFTLRYALSIPGSEIAGAHRAAKQKLLEAIKTRSGVSLDASVFTIGFARRATAYKRADLVFHNLDRLKRISKNAGKIQFVFAGKAHPRDVPGKDIIRRIIGVSRELKGGISVVYLEDYSMELARTTVAGCDLWLNTPRKPMEASGTSGMKAAHNGVPSLSIMDGWWIEGCIEGITGWAIGNPDDGDGDERESGILYDKLEQTILPLYYTHQGGWINVMRHCIAMNASFFNTHRMVQQYALNAYLY